MQIGYGSGNLSWKNLGTLRVEFYESGVGDTIIVTFPSGGIGIIDAYPSSGGSRPSITSLVHGKRIHFVCLTHPHADHGVDLIPVLESQNVESFWHTGSEIQPFIYRVQECVNYPSAVQTFAAGFNKNWQDFMLDIFGTVFERKIPRSVLRADSEPRELDGVKIHILGPEEAVQNRFVDALLERVGAHTRRTPDPNTLSAIIALEYGSRMVLLGADALQPNWVSAHERWKKKQLPKASILKVPHHGARNAMDMGQSNPPTYLDMCSFRPRAQSVLFAGDQKHPDQKVYNRLMSRTDVHCLANGLFAPAG